MPMLEQHSLFLALLIAGLLSTLIVYVTRSRGHHAHHGGLVYDASTTAFHVHVHV